MIITANNIDAQELTNIALRSKAFWGYSGELIESWKGDLTITSKMIDRMDIYKFMENNKTVGFYALNPPETNSIELEYLFIIPEFIGKGIGKQLLSHSTNKAKQYSCNVMTVLSDPNAVAFYESQGFVIIDKKESSIPGRFLPIMQKSLTL